MLLDAEDAGGVWSLVDEAKLKCRLNMASDWSACNEVIIACHCSRVRLAEPGGGMPCINARWVCSSSGEANS